MVQNISRDNTALLAASLAAGDTPYIPPTPAEPGVVNIDMLLDDEGIRRGDILTHDGSINNGPVYTDDLTPTLSGHIEGGGDLTFAVILNTDILGYAVADKNGDWTFTPDSPLEANHEYYFQTMLRDPASDAYLISLPVHIITTPLNADVPASVTLDAVVDDVEGSNGATGKLADHGLTNDARPTLSGTATADAVVHIYENGKEIGSTTASDKGLWSFTPDSDLNDGQHSLSAQVTSAGVTATSNNFWIDVDTQATKPIVTTVIDSQGDHQGNVADGGQTDDSRPVLNGYAEAGARVDVHVFGPNGKELYYESVTADTQGQWHYQPKAFTSYGQYSFGISSVDQAGNAWSDYGHKFSINYVAADQDSHTAPDAATDLHLIDDVGSVQGEIKNNGITDDNQPTLNGHATPGDSILISDNGELIGVRTADSKGNWSFTPETPLNDGSHNFAAIVRDAQGNESAPTNAIHFTVDTLAPDQPIIVGVYDDVGIHQGSVENGGLTDDKQPGVYGFAQPGDRVTIYMHAKGGDYTIKTVTADEEGHWVYTFTGKQSLQYGDNTFTAVVTDTAGNISKTSDSYVVKYVESNHDDTSSPNAATDLYLKDDVGSIKGEIKDKGVTDDSKPTLSGKADAGNVVHVYDNGKEIGSASVDSKGTWSFEPKVDLKDGAHSFTTEVVNPINGMHSADTTAIAFTVDTSIVAMTIDGAWDNTGVKTGLVGNDGVTDDTTPRLVGTAEAGSTIYLTFGANSSANGSTVTDATGHWSFQVLDSTPLAVKGPDNSLPIIALSVDAAGNTSTATFYLRIVDSNQDDTGSPNAATDLYLKDDVGSIKGEIKDKGVTDDSKPTLSGKADAGNVVHVYDNGKEIGSASVDSKGTWSFEPKTALAQGDHSFTTEVVGPNGQHSADTAAINFTVDTVSTTPTITGVMDDVGIKQGNVENGGTTDDKNVVVSGYAEPGSVVTLHRTWVGGSSYTVGHVTADSNGYWEISSSYSNNGLHRFYAVATDVAGNVSQHSANYDIHVVSSNQDVTSTPDAPTIVNYYDDVGSSKGYDGNGGTTDDTTPTLNGKAEANSLVNVYDGSSVLGSTRADSDGSWSFTPSDRNDGKHTFTATATDTAGNTSTHSSGFVVNVVSSSSSPTIPDGFLHFDNAPKSFTSWTSADGAKVTILGGESVLRTQLPGVLTADGDSQVVITGMKKDVVVDFHVELPGAVNEVSISGDVHVDYVNSYIDPENVILYDTHGNEIPTSAITFDQQFTEFGYGILHCDVSDGYTIGSFTVQKGVFLGGVHWNSDVSSTLHSTLNAEATDDNHALAAARVGVDHALVLDGMIDLRDNAPHTLQLTLDDVVQHVQQNLLIDDNHQQLAITGDNGDAVELKVQDLAHNTWENTGLTTSGGVTYEVYHHNGDNLELLVQQGVELHQTA